MSEGERANADKPLPRIGSYQILHTLGSGGMSSVFKATHVETGHEVAVKVLPRTLAKNVTLLQRFLREAKCAEALEHPNIVSIYDRGVDQGRHYLVLEYVEGGDLHDRVRNEGPLAIGEAVAVIRSVSKGLEFAASQGLIHRDIKPANMLRTPSGLVKIIDLGLALQAENEDERVTREGTTVGTVDYMSPEQARDSRATSEQSDIYSLGCTFYFLLTGSPPFPGGDVADKLSRHCLEPAPDPSKLRPEIPAPLSQLIRRMMAKRPEYRFASYQELIDELDVVPTGEPSQAEVAAPEGMLFALIDESEDQDESPSPLPDPQPLFALIDEDDKDKDTPLPARAAEPLFAPIDEEIEMEPLSEELGLLAPQLPAPRNKKEKDETPAPARAELSLAELVSLSDDAPAIPIRKKAPRAKREPVPSPAFVEDDSLHGELFEDLGESATYLGARKSSDATKKLILTYTFVGLGLVFLIIGAHRLVLLSTATEEPSIEVAEAPEPVEVPEPYVAPVAPVPPPRTLASMTPVPLTKKVAAEPAAPTGWVEPSDPTPEVVPETNDGAELESKSLPDWAKSEVVDRLGPQLVSVQRVVDSRDPTQKQSLRLALEVIGGTIEVADDGPFFEDDLRIFGEARVIRARRGFRPVVSVDEPQLDVVREQPAIFVLDGKNLVLEGLDLVVNVQALPLKQSSLFLCKGGTLTLRRCTITVVNPKAHEFALVRTGTSPRPSRILLDRTLVRGSAFTSFDLKRGSAEVVLNRSVIVSGHGGLFSCHTLEPGVDRKIHLVRSLICGRAALIELGEAATGGRTNPVEVHALGSIFAYLAGEGATSLIGQVGESDRIGEQLAWSGDFNVFAGWRDWLSTGMSRSVKMANLAEARAVWPKTDLQSREDSARWNLTADLERIGLGELLRLAPEARGSLTRVASPTPYLHEKTVESFNRVIVPRLAPAAPAAATPPNPPAGGSSEGSTPTPSIRDLKFDLQASPWNGDLGRFLREQASQDDQKIRVTVTGGGSHAFTPILLRDGITLEIQADPGRPADLAPIVWSPARGTAGEALIEVRGGALVLTNVRFSRDRSPLPRHLVLVDGGHLVLNRCRMTAPGVVDSGGGGLIAFRANKTQPLTGSRGVFQTAPDRPVCLLLDTLLITGGDALKAEMGRGLLSLNNCAIAAGGTAFSLHPARVARSRFDVALALEHCTIASERAFVSLGAWQGTMPGPDRPWLVTSRDSAFVSSYDRQPIAHESILLRIEPESLSAGSLFWQSTNDAFEVYHFTARSGAPLAATKRPDVNRQWVKLWGESHMHNVTGPVWSRGSVASTQSVRFLERLHAGDVVPADLTLDPSYHPGRSRLSVGADLTRLQVNLKKRVPPR